MTEVKIQTKTAKVGERILIKRINRRLARDGERLKVCGDKSRSFSDLGRYYLVDVVANRIAAQHVDLERLAKEVRVTRA